MGKVPVAGLAILTAFFMPLPASAASKAAIENRPSGMPEIGPWMPIR